MTRKRDRQRERDEGKTTEQLIADGYRQEAEGRMCGGTSIKFQCSDCCRWFDEVTDGYLYTQFCWKCWRRGTARQANRPPAGQPN